MKTKRYLYSLAASALFLSGAYAADTELVLDASQDGLTWADALWSNGMPQADITALINIADSENPLLIQGEAVAGKLNVYNNSYLLLTGEGNSLKTTITEAPYGNIELYNNSKFVVSDKASLTIANGMSVYVNDNASFEVNNATFTGKFYNKANNVVIQNGSTWNATGYHNGIQDANILVKDSTINSTTGFQMGSGQTVGHSKVLTLENSDWQFGGNGANFCGIVNILDSSITSTGHLNVGAEGGNASGENLLYMKGSSAESLSTMTTFKLWWNTNGGDTSTTLHQAGNTNVTISNAFDSSNNTNGGGNVLWLFSGDNNTAQNSADSSWGDNGKNKNTTGIWKITNAQITDGVETTSTNSLFKNNTIHLKVSSVEGNDLQSIVDWAGETNTFKTAYDVRAYLSTGANTNSLASFTVRDGAVADIGSYVIVGSDAALSGTASFNILNGATYNQKYHLVLQNSTVAGSTGQSLATLDNAIWNRTNGNLHIGVGLSQRDDNPKQDAISGTSVLTIRNSDPITFGGSILLAGSSVDLSESGGTHTNVAKLVIENTQFTMNGELYFGHSAKNGSTIYGGDTFIEVIGENSAFISSKKGLYSGYNTTTYGGNRKIMVSGKNNTVSFGSDGAFMMNSASGAKQYGGSFEVNIQGEGHTFKTANNIDIGIKNAQGGSNTFFVKGASSENKNKVYVNGGTIYVKASNAADSTIVNTFELAGNTVLSKNENNDRINFNLSSMDDAVAGTANFIISGMNNEVYFNDFAVGKSTLETGKVLFKIDGSTHSINVNNFALRTTTLDPTAATLAFVADAKGISTITTSSVNELSGFIDIDFTKYVANTNEPQEFILISAQTAWDASNYETDSENDYIKVNLANENDTWRTFMDGNNLVLEYTSAVIPEPSTFAAIFGAIALALAAYRRKKQ